MSVQYVVTKQFGNYRRGDLITDAADVAGNLHNVVAVTVPAQTPTKE